MDDSPQRNQSWRVGTDEHLVQQLEGNFLCLYRQYRLGGFEYPIGYLYRWQPDEPRPEVQFYALYDDLARNIRPQLKEGDISFEAAINDLYRLTLYVECSRSDIAKSQAVLLLRCKCLIYEATDYILNVPPELGTFFIQCAERFPHQPKEVERQAEELNGAPFANKDERNKVIKIQLIAALCGTNQLYRKHGASAYERALQLLEKIIHYIIDELPQQHEQQRESFGLIGLSQYLLGRVLSGKGAFTESRKAFRRSAEAYVARLRQKEEFLRDGRIRPHEHEEKVSVTLRRAALVTAFGDGYLSFVNGHITRSLESLTLARAALSRNSGLVYLTYVDMLYWACQRAAHSCEGTIIENVIRELSKCREKFRELVPNSHYFHRAGIQLAIALYYRAKLPTATGSEYGEGMRYLDEAIAYAGHRIDGEPRNPHLLATVLVTRSRFLSSRYHQNKRLDQQTAHQYLLEAEKDALEARELSSGIKEMESESWAILGDVYTDLAALHKSRKEKFYTHFDKALDALQQALKENQGENIRIDALCYLRLTKLCLLNPHSKLLAYEYFGHWKKIEGEVEYQYWKVMARGLERKLGGPFLLIKAWDSLNYEHWEKLLSKFLLEEALKKFVAAHEGRYYKLDKLHSLLANYLRLEMGFGKTKVSQLIRDEELMKKIVRMRARPSEVRPGRKARSYSTRHLKEQ